ncbi:MAG TPA: glycoside hydrolase family 15 protein [Stellaceae bacterium]|nr:glycoside hydrolase family 15 protein [Stellaceae bacterium]
MACASGPRNVDGSSREGYPSIARLGVVGDRRTAAVIAADGTVCWLCLPNYDGVPLFGCLLDPSRGGHFRLGPINRAESHQSYLERNNVLVTRWHSLDCDLELTDAMLMPQDSRPVADERRRTLLRRLRCRNGSAQCIMELSPRNNFAPGPVASRVRGGLQLSVAGRTLGLWASGPVEPAGGAVIAKFILAAGEEFWAVLGVDEQPAAWTAAAAERALDATIRYWRERVGRYRYEGPRRDAVIRSALAIELLSFAPTGALAAAATSSLPERVGGDRNYDYRYAWIRDASMAIATLSVLGDVERAERYLNWLARLDSATEMPLQVLYRVDGGTDVRRHLRGELAGYRGSRPVSFGNQAFRQRQIDCFGYLADCAVIYLECGGRWHPDYWSLIRRVADYTVCNWRKPSNGIWERQQQRHFVSSKMMGWTTLRRTLELAERTGANGNLRQWRQALNEIHSDVMENGWSEELGAFRRHYAADTLDASALLIPLVGFLPPDHPRVLATVERIETDLTLNGLVHRFRLEEDGDDLPLGQFEGAFLPCCFSQAAVYAMV